MYLLDDHEVVRDGLRQLLEATEDLRVVGEAATGRDAIREIRALRPRIAVLDVRLPDISGVEVCREVRSSTPETACLMLTSFPDDEALMNAIIGGAAGYVLKEVTGRDLVGDIRKVAQGETLIDPELARRALDRGVGQTNHDPLRSLTEQEQQILSLIAEGLTNRQIAGRIFLSEKTVKNYVSRVMAKLGVSHRTQAAIFALRHRPE